MLNAEIRMYENQYILIKNASIKTWIFFVFSTNVKKTKYILFGTRGFHKFLYRNIERVFNLLRQRSRGNILNSLLFKKLYTRHTNNIRPEQFTTGPLLFNFWVFFEILLFFKFFFFFSSSSSFFSKKTRRLYSVI